MELWSDKHIEKKESPKIGLVLGKFYPLHKGHVYLIETALKHVDFLHIVICQEKGINNSQAFKWLNEIFSPTYEGKFQITTYPYNSKLEYSEDATPRIAMQWAVEFKKFLPRVNVFFSSEDYGEPFARYMGAKHVLVDKERILFPISGRELRDNLYEHWDYLTPNAQIDLQRQIVFCGTESVGKTTAAKLCFERFEKYKPHMIPEYGRQVVKHSQMARYEQLLEIAAVQQDLISTVNYQRIPPLVFIDTDALTTEGYRQYLFPNYPPIEMAEVYGRSTDYIFLSSDTSYVDDGTRLSAEQRKELESVHKRIHPNRRFNVYGPSYLNRMETVYGYINSLKTFS